jgi:hypothetical protein
MDTPPIIVAPVDPECRLTKEECDELERRIKNADLGDTIVCPVPVNIYHWIDGLWILSEDLAEFHASPDAPQQPKKEPGESYYTPPIS